jgi:hypothetical protein
LFDQTLSFSILAALSFPVGLQVLDGFFGQLQLLDELFLDWNAMLIWILPNDCVRCHHGERDACVPAFFHDELHQLAPVVVSLKDERVANDDQQSLGASNGDVEALEKNNMREKRATYRNKI